jgi:4-hydroxybenzoate polyprenyltransferase
MNAVAREPNTPHSGQPSSAGWRVALRLGRVSNLPTVWTNVLAGAVLAGADPAGAAVLLPLLAASLLYVAGMYLNDAFDAEIDARQRSSRPIPSGDVGQALVLRAGFAMLALGVLLFLLTGWRAGIAGLVLAGLIVLYDRHHKGNPFSPVIMGLCRFMVYVAAGLALAGGALTAASWLGAALLLAYLVGLTYTAKQEHLNELGSAWPLAFLAAPLVYGATLLGGAGWLAAAVWLGLVLWVAYAVSFLFRRPRVVPRAVVSLIAGISLLDALLAAGHGAPGVAGLCVLGFALTLAFQRFVPGT